MQEYNRAVEALNDPEILAQFQREQDRMMQEFQELNAKTEVTTSLTTMATTRNQKKRARRKARGIK